MITYPARVAFCFLSLARKMEVFSHSPFLQWLSKAWIACTIKKKCPKNLLNFILLVCSFVHDLGTSRSKATNKSCTRITSPLSFNAHKRMFQIVFGLRIYRLINIITPPVSLTFPINSPYLTMRSNSWDQIVAVYIYCNIWFLIRFSLPAANQ